MNSIGYRYRYQIYQTGCIFGIRSAPVFIGFYPQIPVSYQYRPYQAVLYQIYSVPGVTFLWLTSIVPQLTPSSCQEPDTGCNPPTRTQLGFLYASFGLMSIGSACIGPCSIATLTGTMFRRRFPVVLLLLLWSTFKSPFSGLIQVLIVAFRNRKIHLLPDDCYNHSNSNEMDRVELT
uniref:Putative proton-dependent oligopeptide transporter family n=1 Tax=Helianthus annuus TaxID=4232 RepID=A0A251RKP2_HELAN